jgi:pyruvate/oxaloacetate carboxyltransferase
MPVRTIQVYEHTKEDLVKLAQHQAKQLNMSSLSMPKYMEALVFKLKKEAGIS